MMGIKRRHFLFGGAALAGAGLFAVWWGDRSAASRAIELTAKPGEGSFAGWMKIGSDDIVTLYSPHIDFGQGSNTALAQMLADELDADWDKVRVEQAPADGAFANVALGQGFLADMVPGGSSLPRALVSLIARNMPLQITGGSSAVRFTGQVGMRMLGAAARLSLVEEAAERLGVPKDELTTAYSSVVHAKSKRRLSYGELAEGAAKRSLKDEPKLKSREQFRYIGQPVPRLDIPAKVDGTALYGIDVKLPEMRVATIMMAPVRGGTLGSVEEKPARAVAGVEKVVKLKEAVIVVAKGYWQAKKGLDALSPKFTDGGHADISTATIYEAQAALRAAGKPDNEGGDGDVDAAFKADGAKIVDAEYRVPFLHHAMMEPFAMTAHYRDGRLDVWVGLQDPLATRHRAAEAAGLSVDDVTVHTTLMGGGFGRRFPDGCEIIQQTVELAKQLPYPVKLVWSREEEVRHGTYRCQSSAALKASLGKDGKISGWRNDYVQGEDAEAETRFSYALPAASRRHFAYKSNQIDGPWRSVNSTQQGFYNESFIDELAHAAGQDPYQFRRAHLPADSRHLKVLDAVAQRSGWGSPLPAGHGRGIAIVESFGTIVGEVIEASVSPEGKPVVHKVWAVVDCGTTVNPLNAEAQISGGIIMALSTALGEAVTLEKGAVVQSNFGDYPLIQMAETPKAIDVHFIESGAKMGGIGEPGIPPASPALCNALFAATGKRIRQLPIGDQLKS